jgi:hypothetical protein
MNEKIAGILNTYAGDDTDLCYYVFEILSQEENPDVGLKYFYENIRTNKTNASQTLEKKFSIDELKKWDELYSKYISELLTMVVSKAHLEQWNAEKFYSVLWERINTDLFFEDSKLKAFVIFKFAQNALMPYIEIDTPLTMKDEIFNDILSKNQSTIIKIRHILALNFTQKTEVSSLILNELQKVKTFEEQCVILAVVLDDFAQGKIKGFMQALSSGNIQVESQK